MRRLAWLLTMLVFVGVAAACGSDDEPALDTGGDGTDTTADDGAPDVTTTTFEGDTTATSAAGSGDEAVAHLTDVRVAAQEGFDRFVLEFEAQTIPAYEVEYREPTFHEPGSGETVEVSGEAFLYVRLEAARIADLEGEEVRVTYEGPDRVTGDTTAITEAVLLGDFEATMEWVIGLDAERTFRVATLMEPARVVIDIESSG